MADWNQLLPGETVVCRARATAKDALVLAVIASLVFAISYLIGESLVALILDEIDPLPTRSDFIGSVSRASVVAVMIFFLAYAEEYVVTDHRVVNRHGPILSVLMGNSEMRLRDIADIKALTRGKKGKFGLISTDGGSLNVSFVPGLDRLRGALVRETGLPDPYSG